MANIDSGEHQVFFTWFPKDFKRNTRDKLFILYRKNKRVKIGFTAVEWGGVIGK